MLLERFFHMRVPPKNIPQPSVMESDAVAKIAKQAYTVFLNDYVAHGFNEAEGDMESQGHFYAQAIELTQIARLSQLEASDVIEQQRQRARRNYRQVRDLAEIVLVDQRNYLLTYLINARASEVGCAMQSRPYSGVETTLGQPCHAFALKLLADATLGRGFATGLQEDAVTMLEHHIARKAECEVQHFLAVFEEEEGELP